MISDLPTYTPDGLIGISKIYAEWAHSIVYCEDSGYEVVYERLFRKLAPKMAKFAVVSTGGKSVSEKLARRRVEIALPAIILVDKDYDDLLGKYQANEPLGLCYLRRYSLENYFAQIEGVREVAIEALAACAGACDVNKVDASLSDRDVYCDRLKAILVEMGRYFVVARKHRLSELRTSKTPSDKLFPDQEDSFPLPLDWLEKFLIEMKGRIAIEQEWLLDEALLGSEHAAAFDTACRPWGSLSEVDHIVGKHLLFGILTYVDVRLGTSLRTMSFRELYLRLLNHVSLSDLAYVRDHVYSALAGTSGLRS